VSTQFLSLSEIETQLCDIVVAELGVARHELRLDMSFVEDIGADSLDMVELLLAVEDVFQISLPDNDPDPVAKKVFTRSPFRVRDLAELVYLYQGTGAPKRTDWRGHVRVLEESGSSPFTHRDGRWNRSLGVNVPIFERLPSAGFYSQWRRVSDGMRCMQLPGGAVEIGCASGGNDEGPQHIVELDAFLIDAEPVSTTAFCRFLNSIDKPSSSFLSDWFVLGAKDKRAEHMLIRREADGYHPLPGTERWPMILVSWYGANAYSLWANGREWRHYRDEFGNREGSFLPSEAQWEYAARGMRYQPFPWGDAAATQEKMRFAQHRRGDVYRAETLPLADVNRMLGVSPFGLHHMAGNVWQWCRDWYDSAFHGKPEAITRNALNRKPTGVRSERGGSWIGTAELCRSSYRRGRPPLARGRCLGFRCIGSVGDEVR